MTDNLKQDESPIVEKNEQGFEKDWFLQTFVSIADKRSADTAFMGVTLLTHGFLVSGQLVGGKEYFKGFAEDLVGIFDDTAQDAAQSLKEMIINRTEQIYDVINGSEDPPLPNYIHLKDAKFFHTNGNPIPSNRGTWWRGRLSEISGFALGNLSIPNDSI